ncbi:MAG TPA: ABC transporter permease subunit [Polyangiaceae bacterium]|nr:ABC transporter permease subunit [Polyangiaceae bacterium]
MTNAVSKAQRAFFRLELSHALRSRWVSFTGLVYVLVFGAFVWLGLRESSVLGFTGLSRVVLNLCNAVVIVLPLVALVATAQSVVGSRSSGFFELFLSQPCRRTDWFWAVLASRVLVIVGPLALLLAGTSIAGAAMDEPGLLPLVTRSLLVTIALTWAFVALGLWLSSVARTPERATVYALLAWFGSTALHDFGLIALLLRFKLLPGVVFALAASNPAEAGRLAILTGIDPELSVLGPVGFWLATTLGPRLTLLVGVGWPLALGMGAIFATIRRLNRADLVG